LNDVPPALRPAVLDRLQMEILAQGRWQQIRRSRDVYRDPRRVVRDHPAALLAVLPGLQDAGSDRNRSVARSIIVNGDLVFTEYLFQ
jgi:hypothetical protein